MKQGIVGQPFVYIFALIVMALILFFGTKTILDLRGAADLTELSSFMAQFQDQVDVYYNFDVGSNKELSLVLPNKIQKICFTQPGASITLGNMDPFFQTVLEENERNNLYTWPLEAFPAPAPDFIIEHLDIDISENPLCINKVNGRFKALIETKASATDVYVEISRL